MEPLKGQPSSEVSSIAVQFDDKNIYVAFICQKSYPAPLIAEQSRRDQLEKADDLVGIAFDTYHDSRSAFWFMTNPLNIQSDTRISDNGKYTDSDWDAGWKVKSAVSDSNWTVEFAIPFKSIRYNPRQTTWGVNFGRFIPKTLETSYWSGTMDEDFRVSQFGTLSGLEFPGTSFQSRFIPYTTARYETFASDTWATEVGLDMEFRYKSNITGNFTANPDFATVEGDREKINMTRWELSFPEKRKFFLEGSEMFQNRIQAFYSRRIGEIDFGGKVIGKTGPYAFSLIGVSAKSTEDNPTTSSNEAFPKYQTGVVRVKRDILKSSTIGLLYIDKEWDSGFNRVLSLDGVFHLPHDLHFTTQFVATAPGQFQKNYGGFVRLAREDNIYHYHLRYTELGEDFRESANGVGFITDDNRRELDSAVEYKWWINKAGIEFLKYESNYNVYWSKTSGTLRSWEIIEEMELYLKNKFSFWIDAVRDYQLFEKGFNNYDLELGIGYNTEEWSSTSIEFQQGHNFDRDYWMVAGNTNFKLYDKFSVEYEISKLEFTPDDEDENTWLNIATFNYQFTPDLFLRLFTQHRSATNRFYVYGLFGWRFKLPNSAIYLVYTRDDFDRIGFVREHTELLFLKLAYDFSF